ncbi:MAG: rod shape-determining protein MreD [Planctomycetota bacterium]|jgi:rod shape-determining protein MreD
MRWISFIIILLIAILLEAGNLLNVFAVGGWYVRPAILITLLVYYSFSCRPRDTIICSFIIGFAADLMGGVMGPHMICFGVLGLLLNQSNQILFAKRAIYKAMIVFAVYLIAWDCSKDLIQKTVITRSCFLPPSIRPSSVRLSGRSFPPFQEVSPT